MKKSLITTLVAIPALALSATSFAAEPLQLTAAQMDGVTAGYYDTAALFQLNASPINVTQVNALTFGPAYNSAFIVSGNFGSIRQ